MEALGFFGTFKATTRILLNNWKHFLCLSALLLLPIITLQSAVAPKTDYAQAFSAISSLLPGHLNATASSPQPFDPNDPGLQPQQQPASSIFLNLLSAVCGLFLTFVSLPPLTVSLCRGYLNQQLTLRDSLDRIRKSCIGVVLTCVCLFAAFAAVTVVIVTLCVVMGFLLAGRNVNFAIPVFLVAAVGCTGVIYLNVVWSLASTVTILEEKWGWDAMQKSAYLLKERRGVAFFLYLFFCVIGVFIEIYIVSEEASLPERLGIATLDGGMRTLVHLYSVATTVVLYTSCKKSNNESMDHGSSKYVGLSDMEVNGDL